MHWKTPEHSRQFVFTEEGYVVSKVWCGEGGKWIYTAWGPCIVDAAAAVHRPNMLRTGLASADEAKQICEAHHGATGAQCG